jgi:hypothetical protein
MDAYIRIGLVDQSVQQFHGFPNAHAASLFTFEVYACLDVELNSLFRCPDM